MRVPSFTFDKTVNRRPIFCARAGHLACWVQIGFPRMCIHPASLVLHGQLGGRQFPMEAVKSLDPNGSTGGFKERRWKSARQSGPGGSAPAPWRPGSLNRGRERGCLIWCRRRDLNPHGLRHTPLKRACLPFHHFGTWQEFEKPPTTAFSRRSNPQRTEENPSDVGIT